MITEIAKAIVEKSLTKSEIAAPDEAFVEKLVQVETLSVGPLKISAIVENIPLAEEHARFFSAPEFKELTIQDLPDIHGIRIELNSNVFDIPLPEGTVLDAAGIRNLIVYAMDPAIETFIQLRLADLRGEHSTGFDLEEFNRQFPGDFRLPPGDVVCCPMPQWPRLLSLLERAVIDRLPEGMCVTAKRIDYLVGDQYVPGKLTDLPIIGGLSDIVFKSNLGKEVTREDWLEAAGDVMVVAPIVIAPLLPLTGMAAIASWVATSATFNGLALGLTEAAKGGDIGKVSEQAGKGFLIGAVTGVAGGVAVAKLMPAIANPLLSHIAAGSLTETAATTTEAAIRVVEKGANLEEAAKEISMAALEGVAIGGGGGALGLCVTKVMERLASTPALTTAMNEGLEKGSLTQCLERARTGRYCMGKTGGFFKRVEGYVDFLGDIPGVRKNLSIMAGNSENSAKGAFTELGSAAAFKKAGHDVIAVGKIVNVPGLGRTDIDIFTRAGKWVEKKHVRQISCDDSFRLKIDKMAEALKRGMEVLLDDGSFRKVTDAVFVNSGRISTQAIKYAEANGVRIYQKTPYTRVPV